ncbi:MAG TPA: methyltransferase domain-containing protein [Chloroflexia bacterium]|nr:methyltransferase domain-containing protein [Chloroflexia bacterium]
MKLNLLDKLLCPAPDCEGASLTLHAHHIDMLNYRTASIEEVREGELDCATCKRSYPIRDYVPSFESLFPEPLREEAEYWSKWYGYWWEREQLGFFDLKAPRALLITEGIEVLDPSSLRHDDKVVTHPLLTENPLVREAHQVLDVGCGTGWSSLLLAQHGHEVVACDPSASNMRLAKSYAISQGEYIEYVGAALGYLLFKPGSFDGVTALHSIHHVPNVRQEVDKLREWLRPGGVIALDEHVGTNLTILAVSKAMFRWADAEIYPKVRAFDPEKSRGLPETAHSTLEGVGSEALIEAVTHNFSVESFSSRYVSLDYFPILYYLWRDLEVAAYNYAADVVSHLCRLLAEAFPEGAEYVTLVGRKLNTPLLEGTQNRVALLATPLDAESGNEARRVERSNLRITMLKAERAVLSHRVAALEAEIARLRRSLLDKNSHIEELASWALTLQDAAKKKDQELERQAHILNRVPQVLRRVLDKRNTRRRKKPGR